MSGRNRFPNVSARISALRGDYSTLRHYCPNARRLYVGAANRVRNGGFRLATMTGMAVRVPAFARLFFCWHTYHARTNDTAMKTPIAPPTMATYMYSCTPSPAPSAT